MNSYLRLRLNRDTAVYDDIFRIYETVLDLNRTKPNHFAYRVEVLTKYNILTDRLAKEPLSYHSPLEDS